MSHLVDERAVALVLDPAQAVEKAQEMTVRGPGPGPASPVDAADDIPF